MIKMAAYGALLLRPRGTGSGCRLFPLETVKDPTGAGDSFAGGFMGYLSRRRDLSASRLRRAVVYGSIMASLLRGGFSASNRTKKVDKSTGFRKRYEIFPRADEVLKPETRREKRVSLLLMPICKFATQYRVQSWLTRETESLGAYLRRNREEHGITLEQIEAVTKINLRYLREIEAETLRKPACNPFFTLGFVKTVCPSASGWSPRTWPNRYRLAVHHEGGGDTEGVPKQQSLLTNRMFWIVVGAFCGGSCSCGYSFPREARTRDRGFVSVRHPGTSNT